MSRNLENYKVINNELTESLQKSRLVGRFIFVRKEMRTLITQNPEIVVLKITAPKFL